MPASACAASALSCDRRSGAPPTATVIAHSNNRIHRFEALVESGSERHEAIDTVEFGIEHRPAKNRMSRGVLHCIDLGVGDLNPHIGSVPIPTDPSLHPGALRCLLWAPRPP